MPTALIICPGQRDRLNLGDERILSRYGLQLAGPPTSTPGFDPRRFAETMVNDRPHVQGVLGSSDASGHLATVIGERLGLHGASAAAFLRCHDKLVCRRIQADTVPEATPAFAEVDPDNPPAKAPLAYPFFLKPVTAHLSQLAYTVRNDDEFMAVLAEARARLADMTAYDESLTGRSFRRLIAEELLAGKLVTFEGYMHRGELTPIGITDAVMHPNGISFLRFEYPTALPQPAVERIESVARRLMPALGFDDSVFNIEFFVTPAGEVRIVEVNGRMASQFAPLVKALHGVSTYEIQLDLVTGQTPELPPARTDLVATSFLLRTYSDAIVRSVPDPTEVMQRFGHAHVEILVRRGQRLSENDDDTASHRLAVIALAAPDRDAVCRRFDEAVAMLPFDLDPVTASVR
jgi:formate-dependent phosphoribosylglycinamide formyltransferase (GAR transformylase)